MKLFYSVLASLLIVSCNPSTQREYVHDNEEVLTEEQENKIARLFEDHYEKTSEEIALVTTPNWDGYGNAHSFASNFVDEKRTGKDILTVFSNAKGATLISTFGEMTSIVTDEEGKEIVLNFMFPEFNEGRYFEGLYNGSQAVINHLEDR